MKDFIFIIILFVIVFYICFPLLKTFLSSLVNREQDVPFQGADYPYHTKYILTNAEYKFYVALKPLMDSHSYIICPKVGLKDLFEVNSDTKDKQKYFGKISQKHIDFLICDSNLHPLFAIELDDKSHQRDKVKEKDKFKDELFANTQLTLYRVPTSSSYTDDYIKKYLNLI